MVVVDRRYIIDEFGLLSKSITYIYTDMRHCNSRIHQLV